MIDVIDSSRNTILKTSFNADVATTTRVCCRGGGDDDDDDDDEPTCGAQDVDAVRSIRLAGRCQALPSIALDVSRPYWVAISSCSFSHAPHFGGMGWKAPCHGTTHHLPMAPIRGTRDGYPWQSVCIPGVSKQTTRSNAGMHTTRQQ